ncbi:MAG: tetratricopeptide repeat protein [Clostridia bacterium]|nr:tetratricopeptide repeat protein [Clostridia bacterium]
MKYITRGNSNPKGKPKIYFCSHPEDFNIYFDNISKEILSYQSCSIWYSDNDIDEHFWDNLRQMQLFVIPVTKKLLTTKNAALDMELQFAINNHIPVLPLMQERGLDALFNSKCGNIQFLSKFDNDDTSVRYENKLKSFLSSVLIGDELAEKIRNAFDAYIFLSYRKIDRAYAQKLMKLIHKNDFCRDIAIWYDEFLTPGENFNDAIKDALLKSDLFVLTVTPNLVKGNNYIITTEYPLAKNANKPIFPVELVSTDKNLIKEQFSEIPSIIDAQDENLLSIELLNTIKSLAIKKNDASPEHNYFIGLAYLSGIDVEVDFEKALNLITSSAESGLTIAIEKLADMYKKGIGVARSFKKTIFYQEKLIEIYKDAYYNDLSLDNLKKLTTTILDCGNMCREYGDSILSFKKRHMGMENGKSHAEWFDKAINHFYQCEDLIMCSSYKNELKPALSICFKDIGEIFTLEKKFESAIEYFQKGLLIAEAVASEKNTLISHLRVATGNRYLANVYLDIQNLDKAEIYYKKALKICDSLLENKGYTRVLFESSIIKYSLANLYSRTKRDDLALSTYKEALELCERYELNEGYIPSNFNSVNVCFMLAFYYIKIKDTSNTIYWFEKALNTQRKLIKQEESFKTLTTLCSILKNLSLNYRLICNYEKSNEFLFLELETNKKIHSITNNELDTMLNYAWSHMSIGDNLISLKSYDEAMSYFNNAIDIYKKISLENTHFLPKQNLAICYERLGEIFSLRHNYDSARKYYKYAIEIYEALAEGADAKSSFHYKLANCYAYLSRLLDDKNEKKQLLQKTVEIYAWLHKLFPHYDLYKRNYYMYKTYLKNL